MGDRRFVFRGTRGLLGLVAVALVAFSALVLTPIGGSRREPTTHGTTLLGSGSSLISVTCTTAKGFCIAGDVTGLYPGANLPLSLTITNPQPVPITIQTLSVSSITGGTSACPTSDLSATAVTGLPFTVGSGVTQTGPGSLHVHLAGATGNSCQGFAWTFNYGGTASYSQASTTTSLTTAPNPSLFGAPVTLTATVAAGPGFGTPTGTVSFYEGSPSGSHVLLGASSLSGGTAQWSTSGLPGGTDQLYATYSGNGYFTASTGTASQSVQFTRCITTKVNSLTVTAGQSICVSRPGSVSGGITVQSGGALSVNGASVGGTITSTGATAITVCGATVNGGVIVSNTTGFVSIGDGGDDGPAGCTTNSVTGGVTLKSNTGGAEVAGNSIAGGLTFTSNSGSGPAAEDATPEIESNSINGSLSCSPNTMVVSDGGQKNTVTGARNGPCSSSNF